MSRILVTGGAGFIGSHVSSRLAEDGHDIAVLDDLSKPAVRRPAGDLIVGDVGDAASVRAALRGCEMVVHLAAQIDVRASIVDPGHDAMVNVVGSLNVLQAAVDEGVRKVVLASTCGVYGDAAALPATEGAAHDPRSPYAIAKLALHHYARFFEDVHGLDTVVLAMGNVAGPRQDPRGEGGVVAIFIASMLAGDPTTIYGDGAQTRDFVDVRDAADAFAAAVERGRGVYNIGTGVETSVLDLWRRCARITGYEGEPSFAPARPGEVVRSVLDSTRARVELGWSPRRALDETLEAVAEYVRSL